MNRIKNWTITPTNLAIKFTLHFWGFTVLWHFDNWQTAIAVWLMLVARNIKFKESIIS